MENFQALLQAEEEDALVTNEKEFDCPICLIPIDPGEGVRLRGCLHQFCKSVCVCVCVCVCARVT